MKFENQGEPGKDTTYTRKTVCLDNGKLVLTDEIDCRNLVSAFVQSSDFSRFDMLLTGQILVAPFKCKLTERHTL